MTYHNCEDEINECRIYGCTARIIAQSEEDAIQRIIDYIVRYGTKDDPIYKSNYKYNARVHENFVRGKMVFITEPRKGSLFDVHGNFNAYHARISYT